MTSGGWTPALTLTATLWAAAICGGCVDKPIEAERFLLPPEVEPLVLVESRTLEAPPSWSGNRFVQGWWPWREGGNLHLVAYRQTARLQLVQLEPRERTLVLDNVQVPDGPADLPVRVRVDGAPAGEFPASHGRVTLPAATVPGRTTVDLEIPEGAKLAVDGAGTRDARPAGAVARVGHDLTQSGFSMVELATRVDGAATLVGAFSPPTGAREGQRFSLWIEAPEAERSEVWSWSPGWFSGTAPQTIEVPLPPTGGLVRVSLLALGEGPPGLWLGLGLRGLEERPEPPPLAAPEAPELVVVYVLDALRADRLGHLGGDPALTPNVDRLAADGVVFARHQSTAPNTLPSTKTLFTGQTFIDKGMDSLPPSGEGPRTLSDLFAEAGFRTAVFTGNGYVYHRAHQGFGYVEESVLYTNYEPPGYNDNAERIHRAALDWLDRTPVDEPVFLYIHAVNPHNPYQPPPALEARFTAEIPSSISGSTETLLDAKRGRVPIETADRRRLSALYDAGVAYADAELGAFLQDLGARYDDGEVLVVLTSDHGEELFDHEGLLHGWTLHREQLEVPLAFWWPGVLETPARIELGTDHLDLHLTLRRLVDRESPAPPGARSLWPLLLGSGEVPDKPLRFASASGVPGGIFSAQDDRWKLIWAPRQGAGWGQGEGLGRSRDPVYLFDLEEDPEERRNLAGAGSIEETWLQSRLTAWIERQRALESGQAPEALTEDERRNLEALGYLD